MDGFPEWLRAELKKRSWKQADLARAASMDPSHLRRMIRDGKLRGRKPGHDWLIAVRDLRGLTRQKSGRPRKAA